MSDTKFQASEQIGSEEEDFWIVFMYFWGGAILNPGPNFQQTW